MSKLEVFTAAELMTEWNAVPEEQKIEMERQYRRGYRDGYLKAAHAMSYIKAQGFVRLQEVSNILESHAMYTLFDWMTMETDQYIAPFPIIIALLRVGLSTV